MPAGIGSRLTSLVIRYSGVQKNPACPPIVDRVAVAADIPAGTYQIVDNGGTLVVYQGDGVHLVEKIAGADGFNAGAVSVLAPPGDFHLQVTSLVLNGGSMVGMNSDPLTDNDYASIDYTWQNPFSTLGNIQESGSLISSPGGGTKHHIWLIGTDLYYGRGADLAAAQAAPDRTVAGITPGTLYFDSSLLTVSDKVEVLLRDLSNTVYNVSVLAASTPAPALSRSAGKLALVASTPAPRLLRSTGKLVNGASTPVPRLVRANGKNVLVTSTPVPLLSKAMVKTLRVTSTLAPSLLRQTGKMVRTTSTPVPTLTTSRGYQRSLLVTSTPVPTLRRDTSKLLLTASTPVPRLTRATSKSLLVASTLVPTLNAQKVFLKTVQAQSTPVPSLAKSMAYTVNLQAVVGAVASGGAAGPRVTAFFYRG